MGTYNLPRRQRKRPARETHEEEAIIREKRKGLEVKETQPAAFIGSCA